MSNTMPVKDALRAHLARRCTEEELRNWYDPLHIAMDQEKSRLTVMFPHRLFGAWFAKTGQEAFESCLAPCLGGDIPVHYAVLQQDTQADAPLFPFSARSVRGGKPFGEAFTLENFIVNKKNFFPLAIAREVTKPQQEPNYNPLVYYGKSGSGKTHILRAIANELCAAYDYHAIFYGSIAELVQEYEHHGNASNAGRYQVYFVDDIHLAAGNFSLQEKLVVFLDACLYGKKQFVCACSGSLASHRGFSESLRSRLELGLIAALNNPDIDVRMRFAQAQCALHGISLAQEHMLLLAQRCEHLRYLSGVLLKIAAYKKHTQHEIAPQDIEKILQHSGEHSPITPQDIIRRVAKHFSLPPEELMNNQRKPALVFARQMTMYLCREILGLSYPAIGQILGGKDHSTVMYGIKKIENYIVTHKNAHTEITELKHLCSQRHY